MQRGDWDAAITECKGALQVTPTNAKIRAYLGMCLFRKNEFALAAEEFRKATTLDPNFWQAGTKLAQCLDRLRRHEEAYEVARHWLRVMPADHTLQGLVLGLEYQVRGNRQEGWERTAGASREIRFTRD